MKKSKPDESPVKKKLNNNDNKNRLKDERKSTILSRMRTFMS